MSLSELSLTPGSALTAADHFGGHPHHSYLLIWVYLARASSFSSLAQWWGQFSQTYYVLKGQGLQRWWGARLLPWRSPALMGRH